MIDPVLVEIVKGSLASIEKEVETAIGRTARSPMIRDAHDFRAGIHDRKLRKLTGRSYSALVHPVVRDYPLETMRPGDVFFHNDVYLSEGGIGHLPDLCVTVPVFHEGEVAAFVQAFGHHDDIGGAVPGSMPSRATSVYEEGLMVPPIRLWDQGVPNDAALKIMTRNSRMPESLAADLDAECAACLMGGHRLADLFARYGRDAVEECFDAIIDATTQTYRREVLAKIPNGTWVWEDYAEHDGVDPPRLHRQRITLTKTPEKLVLDFTGTGPQGTITRQDVQRAAEAAKAAPAGVPAGVPGAGQAVPAEGREERIPVKGVRKAMASAMVASAFSVPHVTEFLQVDVTATVDAVARLRQMPDFAEVKVSPLLLVARALLVAVRRHPLINSSWNGDEVVVKHYVNLGIAAATERGLIVPNIKNAQALSLPELARALTELTARARAGRTQPAEMTGGTITITNVGVFGVDAGTPIINPGEAAILAFGQIRDLPWVVDGAIVPRKVCTLALSFDHRIVDGELGSKVLRDVGDMLEDPLRLLAWS
mgnify:CR=1 FL=1